MAQTIEQQIETYFSSPLERGEHRKILYLYDEERKYWETVTALAKESGLFKVLEVNDRRYFKVQYQIERELTEDHLFLYYTIPQPSYHDNPLLDVLLYSKELRVDEESQLLLTLGISPEEADIREVVERYPVFFRSKERTQRFRRLFHSGIRSKETAEFAIFAALTRAEAPDWMAVLMNLFDEEAAGESAKWDMLVKFGDVERFWGWMDRLLGYNEDTSVSGNRSVHELMTQVFFTHLDSEMANGLPKKLQRYILPNVNQIIVFLNQWMNARTEEDSYRKVAFAVQNKEDFSQVFDNLSSSELADPETFEWFDHAVIRRTVSELLGDTVDYERTEHLLSQRRNKFWYPAFRKVYHALKWSVRLLRNTDKFLEEIVDIHDAETMWNLMRNEWYRIDQAYRKFYTYLDGLDNDWKELLADLKQKVEWQYVREYLTKFTEKWDRLYTDQPDTGDTQLQAAFYQQEVQPFAEKNRRVFVLISDGLRYEAGKELFLKLTETTRYNGDIDWMKTELPSVTSVGMGNLLPHEKLEFFPNGDVRVDNQPTNGLENRAAVLRKEGHPDAIAVQAEQLNQLNKTELRSLMAGKKVVYIYQNRIDAIGDHRPTENEVFEATQETIEQLKRLMDRLTTEVSASQFLVTADHGYLYTRESVRPTEKVKLEGSEGAWIKNKRFLVSKQPIEHFSGLSLPLSERLSNEGYVLVPRGMNRFALQGGGYQYVHGGHLPQETLVPLLRIKTDRSRNELEEVAISLVSQTRTLTNSVVWLDFLQLEPVSDLKKEKRLNLYFEDETGEKISNEVLLIADSENDTSAERVFKEKFVFLNHKNTVRQTIYFVMENVNDRTDVKKEIFEIDLV